MQIGWEKGPGCGWGQGRSLRSEEAHRGETGGRKQNTEVAGIANKRGQNKDIFAFNNRTSNTFGVPWT